MRHYSAFAATTITYTLIEFTLRSWETTGLADKTGKKGAPITHLMTQDRTILHALIHINDEFRSYYMTLCSTPLLAERVALNTYLGELQLRMLPVSDSEQLGAPVTAQEVQTAIKDLETQC
ncbi:hypothetical protein NDU88_005848 [Pleurodeles waltl]|uniref:Uncharacterized protein n=1 Tax=Pleurodeles waltl TaxID=8319 RepID=A0AAV7VN33_PLEWA|nr:hypothetical protein NDU88_005848 [Pleurodeles waltl]